jgi:hypothetical protein
MESTPFDQPPGAPDGTAAASPPAMPEFQLLDARVIKLWRFRQLVTSAILLAEYKLGSQITSVRFIMSNHRNHLDKMGLERCS